MEKFIIKFIINFFLSLKFPCNIVLQVIMK